MKIYNLSEDSACIGKAREYGIRALPTIIVDGRVKIEGKPTPELIKRVIGT